MANVNITHVPYKTSTAAVNDLLVGTVQVMVSFVPTVLPHIKSGRLRALAVTTAAPFAGTPGLPTVSASGLPGYEYDSVNGILTTAKTSPAIVNRLNQEFTRAINLPEIKERVTSLGGEVVTSTPEEFARKMRSDVTLWTKRFKDMKIRIEATDQ